MPEKKDSKGRAKIINIGTFDEADKPQGWVFDRQGRVTDWGNHIYKVGGYTNAELHKICEWSEKRDNAIPDAFEVAAILTDEPAKVETAANQTIETPTAEHAPAETPESDQPAADDKCTRDDRATGKREDVFFNFCAHLDQIVLKDTVQLKMTTDELPEAVLSNGDTINLSKAADNDVDVEIRISRFVKAIKDESVIITAVVETSETDQSVEIVSELPLETATDAVQDAVISENAETAIDTAPEPENAPAAEAPIVETPAAEVPAEPIAETQAPEQTQAIDF